MSEGAFIQHLENFLGEKFNLRLASIDLPASCSLRSTEGRVSRLQVDVTSLIALNMIIRFLSLSSATNFGYRLLLVRPYGSASSTTEFGHRVRVHFWVAGLNPY